MKNNTINTRELASTAGATSCITVCKRGTSAAYGYKHPANSSPAWGGIMAKLTVCLLFLFATTFSIYAEVKLPRLISDGMILQRETPVKIWGWASKNETIILKFQGQSYKTKADKTGSWKIELPAQTAGGPHTMEINKIVLKNILFGDVWLCSGQSNMELPISRVLDLYRDEVKDVSNDNIRLFHVPLKYNFQQPETDFVGGEWKSVTPENLLNFSAAAYFFAKNLYDKYQVPIGLLRSAVGGSPAEAWLSEEALKDYPHHIEAARLCTPSFIDSVTIADRKKGYDWITTLNSTDKGVSNWFKPDTDVSDWNTISLPGYWTDKNPKDEILNSSVWFRKDFDVPASMTGQEAILRLGCIIDSDSAYINGTFVGSISYQYPPRIYNVPAGLLKEGKNNITVRVISNSGRGGFVEEKPYKIIAGNQTIDLTGEWLYKVGAKRIPSAPQTTFQYKPMGLFNSMINPLLNYSIKGVIWYQGESNTGRTEEYKKLFPGLINNWRAKWNNPELPFIYVQLANFMKIQREPVESGWAELREIQRKALSLPHTGMAVAIDLGEWNDIHPLNKKDIGHRLALEAQRVAYNENNIISCGPLYKDMTIEGNAIILRFSSVGSGLYANNLLQGFAIAGEDGKFTWADAAVVSQNTVKVWSNKIKNPTVVRYAWADNPAEANLKNKEGLPASPFSTKD